VLKAVRSYLSALRRSAVCRLRGDADSRRLQARGLRIGERVYINGSARLDEGFLWLISIGNETTIGPDVRILVHDATTKKALGYAVVAPVTIGSRVFLGAGSIVLPGVTIGDGTIVGAGSVVREDLPAGVLAIGHPASVVCPADEFIQGHRRRMETRPKWPFEGWTLAGGITEKHKREMLESLRDGPGYVR
jgi:maltose O-acetyltransferase